jgi:hypothetical protein
MSSAALMPSTSTGSGRRAHRYFNIGPSNRFAA